MENLERLSLSEMEEFIKGNGRVRIGRADAGDAYGLIERVLRAQRYRQLKKSGKGTVRRFLTKVTGLSRAQVTRLIARWMLTRRVEKKPARRAKFAARHGAGCRATG
jgi:hypothetical protein